ncbi:MAG: hypothetical protein WCK01_05985, partial [Candidatus Uhrbacteria bacterium]
PRFTGRASGVTCTRLLGGMVDRNTPYLALQRSISAKYVNDLYVINQKPFLVLLFILFAFI